MPMSGNVSKIEELSQCSELVGSIAKAMALVAPKMTKQARQSWIGLPPADFARAIEKMIFLPVDSEKHIIDLDADPFKPDDWLVEGDPFEPDAWSVEEHKKGGQFQWNAVKVELYLVGVQKGGKVISGNKLRKALAKKPVFNANLLDYLLANPHLIPEEWKGKLVFFWGTVYRDWNGRLCVRFLHCDGDWGFYWLDNGWDDNYPAVVDAS